MIMACGLAPTFTGCGIVADFFLTSYSCTDDGFDASKQVVDDLERYFPTMIVEGGGPGVVSDCDSSGYAPVIWQPRATLSEFQAALAGVMTCGVPREEHDRWPDGLT